jgi:PAS domain S-box-containing protein
MLKEEDIKGSVIYEIGDGIWDIPQLKELLEEKLKVNQQVNSFELHHNFSGIGEKHLVINARKISQTIKNKQLILLAIEDVTDFMKSQMIIKERAAKINSILQKLPHAVWMTDPDGNIIFKNREAERLYVNEKKGEIWDFLMDEDRDRIMKAWKEHLLSGNLLEIQARSKINSSNLYRWHLIRVSPVTGNNGKIISWIGTNTDIHEQKSSEELLEKRIKERTEALENAYSNLERSNNELEQFAYVATHDLQEPLRKIQTFINLLYKNIRNETLVENYYVKVMSSAQRMSNLILDVLNFSKINHVNKTAVIDLNDILKQVLIDFELIISEKKVIIRSDKLPVIRGYSFQMIRLFSNIIGNAIKFNNGKPIIQIRSSKLSKKEISRHLHLNALKSYHEIVISDNGIGFSQEYSEQIFTMFQQLHNSKEFSGTGIGLAICKKIVENHGGVIFATSKKKKGSEFHIILPSA